MLLRGAESPGFSESQPPNFPGAQPPEKAPKVLGTKPLAGHFAGLGSCKSWDCRLGGAVAAEISALGCMIGFEKFRV